MVTIGLGVLGANSRAAAQPRGSKGAETERAQAPLSPSAAPASSSPPVAASPPPPAPGGEQPAPAASSPPTPETSPPPAPSSAAPTPPAINPRVPPPNHRPYIFRPMVPVPVQYWYGWQTLIVHGVAATSALLLLPATGGDAAVAVVPIAIGAATLGGPIVHWAHGKVGTGFASFGITIGMTLGGALFGGTIGAVIEMVSEGGRRDSGLGFFVGSAMGAPFGAVGAYAIDLSLLSFSEEEPPSRRPPVSLLPLVRIDGERTVMGLAGTF